MQKKYELLFVDESSEVYEEISGSGYFSAYSLNYISDPNDLQEHLKRHPQDLIVMELAYSGKIDYVKLLKRLQKDEPGIPVIILSRLTDAADAVIALELGAEDYIRKPVDKRELLARIKKVIDHKYNNNTIEEKSRVDHCAGYCGLIIDKNSYTVSYNGTVIPMTPKAFELLYFLASNPDRVFSRDVLLTNVWGFDYYGGTRTVDVHVRRIRGILNDYSCKCPIVTVFGAGYKYVSKEDQL